MILLIIALVLLIVILVWHLLTFKYLSPWKTYMITGKRGAGKSTILTKLAYNALKHGTKVYSTEYLEFEYKDHGSSYTLHTILIDPTQIYKYQLAKNSLVLIDEVGTIWHSRSFKTHDMKVTNWFKMQRKRHCTVYLFSQTFDIDKSIRELVDYYLITVKILRVFIFTRRLQMQPVVVHASNDGPTSIQDDFVEQGLIARLFSGLSLTFLPRWAKWFDTDYVPDDGIRRIDPENLEVNKHFEGQEEYFKEFDIIPQDPEIASDQFLEAMKSDRIEQAKFSFKDLQEYFGSNADPLERNDSWF